MSDLRRLARAIGREDIAVMRHGVFDALVQAFSGKTQSASLRVFEVVASAWSTTLPEVTEAHRKSPRNKLVRQVRWTAWHVLKGCGMSLPQIGRCDPIAMVHHTTVLHALHTPPDTWLTSFEIMVPRRVALRAGDLAYRQAMSTHGLLDVDIAVHGEVNDHFNPSNQHSPAVGVGDPPRGQGRRESHPQDTQGHYPDSCQPRRLGE